MAVAEQSISLKTRRKTEFKHTHSWLTDLFCGFAASLRGYRDGIVFFKEFEKFVDDKTVLDITALFVAYRFSVFFRVLADGSSLLRNLGVDFFFRRRNLLVG